MIWRNTIPSTLPAVLLLFGSIASVTVNGLVCPPSENVSPCICVHNSVFCHSEITTTTDLERAMNSLTGKGTFTLSLRNLNLGNLSLPIFKNLSITEIEITDSKLEGIMDTDIQQGYVLGTKLKVLKILNSINDTKENFRMQIFSLKSLKSLEITHNVFRKLRSEIFDLTPNTVTQLTLKENRIETIADGTFAKMSLLAELNLDKNKIRNLTRSILPSTPYSLKKLSLAYNNISTLPDDFFWRMPFLLSFDVDYNKIMELPERTWRSVWSQFNFLYLSGNPLICDSRIEWTFMVRGPRTLSGNCHAPPERKYKALRDLIFENRQLSIKKKSSRNKGFLRMKSKSHLRKF